MTKGALTQGGYEWNGEKAGLGPVSPAPSLHQIAALLEARINDAREIRASLNALNDRVFGPVPVAGGTAALGPAPTGLLDEILGQIDTLDRVQSEVRDLVKRLEQMA